MNSIATSSAPKSSVTKRILSFVLVVMLTITVIAALFGDRTVILNAGGLLTLLWPTALIGLSSYWLRLFLDERTYLDYGAEIKVQSHLSSSGLYMAPVFLVRL